MGRREKSNEHFQGVLCDKRVKKAINSSLGVFQVTKLFMKIRANR